MGALIETGSRSSVFLGYALGAALMLIAAAVAAALQRRRRATSARGRRETFGLGRLRRQRGIYAAWPAGASITRAFSRAKLFGVMYQLK